MATHSSKVAHKTGPHHLSQQSLLKEGGASDGWVESLTSLTEAVQATQLLDEGAFQVMADPWPPCISSAQGIFFLLFCIIVHDCRLLLYPWPGAPHS